MICPYCQTAYPDTADACPVCGRDRPRKRTLSERILPLLLGVPYVLVLAMNAINALFMLTAAHYATDLRRGGLTAMLYAYEVYPGLEAIDITFLIALIVPPIVATVGLYFLYKEEKKGVWLMLSAEAIALLWCLVYLFAVGAVTEIVSPMRSFCLGQAAAFTVLVLPFSVWLVRSKRFV